MLMLLMRYIAIFIYFATSLSIFFSIYYILIFFLHLHYVLLMMAFHIDIFDDAYFRCLFSDYIRCFLLIADYAAAAFLFRRYFSHCAFRHMPLSFLSFIHCHDAAIALILPFTI